jgi:hypothetical protein
LKQLGLLGAKVNDQSKVDEILRSVTHYFNEFRRKYKGKEVCSSFELIRGVAKSMTEPESGMDMVKPFSQNRKVTKRRRPKKMAK